MATTFFTHQRDQSFFYTPSFLALTMERVETHYPFYTERGEELEICLAITKFKSLSTYYMFAAWLIYLTNFLGGHLILYLDK